jgi:hypothetical protein
MITALLIAAIVSAPAPHVQTIEGCHWNDSSWVYDDGSLCRGTGEDPTVGSDGLPACADGRLAVPQGDRVMCISPVKGGSHGGAHRAAFDMKGSHGKR